MVIFKNHSNPWQSGRTRHSVRAVGRLRGNGAHGVTRPTQSSGLLMTEVMVGLAIIGLAIFPLAYSFAQESKYLRRCYERAVAMEIVDGEMEIIRAGGWRSFTNGVFTLETTARSATNLPPGELRLTLTDKHARLEWLPAKSSPGSPVVREATLK
jgi:hypothetical protein